MKNQNSNVSCTVCGSHHLETKLGLGPQSPSNLFVSPSEVEAKEDKFELALGYCKDCYTPQLTQRLPRAYTRPRFEWLMYNEPENHLDDVVSHLVRLPNLKKDDAMVGISYKDQTTFDRLSRIQFSNSTCLTKAEFDIFASNPILGSEKLKQPVKLILARHVIEHADSAVQLILQLKEFLSDDGYLVLEIPSNEKIFKNLHYPFIWEEHLSYFTKESIEVLANTVGADVTWSKCYEYEYEDSLVFALSFNKSRTNHSSTQGKHFESTITLLEEFCSQFTYAKSKWQNYMQELKSKGEKIAFFGAGHLSVKFINFFELAPFIDCVIDDHPEKVKLLMPGSKLPICPSSELASRKIKYCFSTLSPESEQKVRKKMQSYLDAGGDFISAFDSSMAHV